MTLHPHRLIVGLGLVFALLSFTLPALAEVTLDPSDIDWQTIGTDVRFHMKFRNLDPVHPTAEVSGTIKSQEFGVFLPDYGTIGSFNVPPMQPNSFFDVFFDVPLANLPPSAGGGYLPRPGRITTNGVPPPGCPPDDHWDGNVDVNWAGPGGAGQVNAHFGNLQVCPGMGKSFLHVITACNAFSAWAINGVCPGFNVQLLNENPPGIPNGPAPALLPPGWMGFISVTANPGVPVGAQCCFTLTITCNGVPAVINVCAVACQCLPTPAPPSTWGRVRNLYR